MLDNVSPNHGRCPQLAHSPPEPPQELRAGLEACRGRTGQQDSRRIGLLGQRRDPDGSIFWRYTLEWRLGLVRLTVVGNKPKGFL